MSTLCVFRTMHSILLLAVAVLLCLQAVLVQCNVHGRGHGRPAMRDRSGSDSSGESSDSSEEEAGPHHRGPHHRECPFEDKVVCSAMSLCTAICRSDLEADVSAPDTTEAAPADVTTDAAPADVTTDAADPRPTMSFDEIQAIRDAAETFCPPCPTTTAAPTTAAEVTPP
jgi:hypothetical protein